MKVDDPRLLFLNRLERLESQLLSWGLVDGSFHEDELESMCEEFIQENNLWNQYESEEEFHEALEEKGLLFPTFDGMESRYRTRMGETVRLLARLRQLFPNHLTGANRRWQTARPLIGDFRFMLRGRLVPQRRLEQDAVASRIDTVRPMTKLQRDSLAAILSLPNAESMQLAKFQARATENILRQLNTGRRSGTIVCAGTGSGKTLSFYLPAFLAIVESIDSSEWTRCLALYPRNELLKDQLSEAYGQARKLDNILAQNGKRKLTIATLFGATPNNERAFEFDDPPPGWKRVGGFDGHICPFLTCPAANCQGQMYWANSDRKAGIHRLRCRNCQTSTEHDELILTRDRLKSSPADILFTTTEMLNQRMGDSRFAHVFGIGSPRNKKPSMVLLDEVHTYAGISGAQTALLLRRWKYAASVSPHFVGLSATLADARKFFAILIGEQDCWVEEIAPHPNELDRVGMEYLLALRGDPASQTSLLSTSIQTAMLMRRVLDSNNHNTIDSGVYGSKEFIFTDDLDVTNRFFFNLRDAEGQNSWGNADPNRHPNGSLANLRRTNLGDDRIRNRFGQYWDLCERLGHRLNDGNASINVERTSSQDAGVATNADIIVATAALEVGFNDPEVNVVLQHKAPRDAAQFLQRKGRAGRRIEMRPWTLVSLSDYGRDRLAWESFDLLFDPQLPPRELPIRNRYVLRMQIVFAFFDWIAIQLRRQPNLPAGSVYEDFSGPASEIYRNARRIQNIRTRQLASADIIEGILFREEGLHEMVHYLSESLNQDDATIESLLWDPPRALMTAALPTLLRRVQSDWKRAGDPDAKDNYIANNPLPEFVPGQLFGDLNLPEVAVVTPPQQSNDQPRRESMPILQALREFAPGRVSMRFGVMNKHARHWIVPGDIDTPGEQTLELSRIVSRHDELGYFDTFDDAGNKQAIRCVRPREFELTVPDPTRRIRDSSNASLKWNTQINPQVAGIAVDLPSPSRWEDIVKGIDFFTHSLNNPLEIRRFATESMATIVFESGQDIETNLLFVEDAPTEGHVPETTGPIPVGIGFAIDVDGLVLRYELPKDLVRRLSQNPAMLRCLRIARFGDLVSSDPLLANFANFFQLRWLSQVYLSALTSAAIERECTLEQCWELTDTDPTILDIASVLAVIFQSIAVSSRDNDDADHARDDELDDVQQQLQHDLAQLLLEEPVINSLRRLAPALWETPDHSWVPWLTQKFKATLGAAVLDAIQQVCIDLDARDLLLDIDAGPRPDIAVPADDNLDEIWLTERTVGGGGIIESFLTRFGEDPRRFFDLVENALRPSDYEITDQQLTLLLDWIASPHEVEIQQKIAAFRNAATQNHQSHAKAFEELRSTLSRRGLFTCHGVIAAIGNRILRPGSSVKTDALLHGLISRWQSLESKLEIEIDPRILAYHESANDAIDDVIQDTAGNIVETNRRQWRFNAIFSLLWPRGGVSRSARLSTYNAFAILPTTEHDLVRLFLAGEPQRVSVNDVGWRESLTENLVRDSEVILESPADQLPRLREALLDIMTLPIDSGYMLLHPKVNRIDRRLDRAEIVLTLPEGIQ